MRRACLKAAYNVDTDDWTCAECGKRTERASADHIHPVGLASDWNEFIEMMFFGELQCLDKQCHKTKTKQDLKRIKEKRDADTESRATKYKTRKRNS